MKAISLMKVSNFFYSLRTRLLLYFISVSIAVLAVGFYLTYRNMLGMLEQRNEELVLQQFKQTEQNILNLMSDINRLSGLFFLGEDVQKFLYIGDYSLPYENVEMVRNILRNADDIIYNYPYIDSIYLFTKSKEVIGASKTNSVILRKDHPEHPFFSDVMYEKAKVDDTKSNWYGGYTRYFFNEALRFTTTPDAHLITQVRGVRATSNPNINGILVLNIDEQYLFSLYNRLGNDAEGKTYIVDGNGIILSGSSGSIDMPSSTFEKISKDDRYGSTTLHEGKSSRQLIYYNLQSLGWYILTEVPLKIDSEYAVYLQRTFVIVLLLSIFAIFVSSFFWLKKITDPLGKLAGKMTDVGHGNLGLTLKHIPKNELGVVITRFNEMSVSIAELIKQNKQMEEEKRKLEIETLQAQINPHFLYNTLNMIKWMAAVIKAKNIVDSLVALGNILRPVFKNSGTMSTLKEEIIYLENYVKIMNWRFGNGIRFRIDMKDELINCKVPRFILQPLVENSFAHGLKDGEGCIDIDISISETDQDLLISVSDNGVGIPYERLEKINQLLSDTSKGAIQEEQGIGIFNVNRRIRLYCGDSYGIRIMCPVSGGTIVVLKILKVL